MLKTDYRIDGLDDMTIEMSIKGTAHFMNNIVSGWYSLDEVNLTPGGKVKLQFTPADEIKHAYPAKECSLVLSAHKSFSLIEKEQYSTDDKTTIKYVFINCQINDEGQPYFHYEILQKTMAGVLPEECIHINTTAESLISEGYSRLKSIDDKARSGCMVVLENHRKAS